MTVTLRRRDVYGNSLVYPVCQTAQTLASMVGRKTLTDRDLDHIRRLGYTIQFVA